MINCKHIEHKIEMKQLFLYFTVLVTFVLSSENAAVGFTPSAKANENVNTGNPPDALPFANGWIQTDWPADTSFFNLCNSTNKVFARTWDSFNGGRMFLTADNGTNWTQIGSADSSIDILSIVMLDSRILAGTWNGFFQSTDDGTTWNAFTPTGIPADAAIWSIVKINTTLFAGTTGDVYKSTDNGNTWTGISSGIAAGARITSIVASGDNIFAGSAGNGVFKLTNNGTSWTTINSNLTDTHILQLVVLDNKLFAVTLTGVFISDIGGTSWEADPSDLRNVNCFVAVNDQLIAGTDDNGAYLSDDNGVTWTSFSSGMPADTRIWSLAKNRDGIFAGTSSGIWFMSFPNEVYVETEISVPLTLTLEQNYPNPFSTSTTISFSIPSKSFVSLKIYDRLGREVATIISEEIPAGYYTRKWNAADLSGGIYFYRLQAGSYSETKKLILLP
jgi:photosystem II stability/assembly factor-like uncharacterized protein